MITREEFAKLRLAMFVDASEIFEERQMEFMGRLWVGESVEFTSFLRPVERPDDMECISLNLRNFAAAPSVLQRISLPLRLAQSQQEVAQLLGQGRMRAQWTPIRVSHQFLVQQHDDRYLIVATFEPELMYVTVVSHPGVIDDES